MVKMSGWTYWLVLGPIIAVIYMVVGYHIAKTSRRLRKNFDKRMLDGNMFATAPLKIFLYPTIVAESSDRTPPCWFLDESSYNKPSYVIEHLFFWPLRVIGNVILILLLFVLTPIISFLAVLIFGMIAGAIEAVAKKIKTEADS